MNPLVLGRPDANVFTDTAIPGGPMLDAYIIDRIHRERERARHHDRVPLHIEPPRIAPPRDERREDRREDEPQERGSVVIDFHV